MCLNPCFDRIYFQFTTQTKTAEDGVVSILVLIEFIFNDEYIHLLNRENYVSILVLIEFIFNLIDIEQEVGNIGLNPCFDRIYFQFII